MRPIKFKWFNKKNNTWLYWNYIENRWEHFITGWEIEHNPFATPEDYRIDIESLGQFTWLLDKNKNDLYEGDIVKSVQLDWKWDIVWSNDFCCFLFDRNWTWDYTHNLCWLEHDSDHFDMEIIGNIYQNPELLKNG